MQKHINSKELKRHVHTWLLCMQRIARDEHNPLPVIPSLDLVGNIFDSRKITEMTFSIDAGSHMLVELHDQPFGLTFLMGS